MTTRIPAKDPPLEEEHDPAAKGVTDPNATQSVKKPEENGSMELHRCSANNKKVDHDGQGEAELESGAV